MHRKAIGRVRVPASGNILHLSTLSHGTGGAKMDITLAHVTEADSQPTA